MCASAFLKKVLQKNGHIVLFFEKNLSLQNIADRMMPCPWQDDGDDRAACPTARPEGRQGGRNARWRIRLPLSRLRRQGSFSLLAGPGRGRDVVLPPVRQGRGLHPVPAGLRGLIRGSRLPPLTKNLNNLCINYDTCILSPMKVPAY